MADIRCPMCGRPNPDTDVECQHCGSRLKPLVVSGATTPAPPASQTALPGEAAAPPSPPGAVPPWLQRLRSQTGTAPLPRPAPQAPASPPQAEPQPASVPQPPQPQQPQPPAGRRGTGELFRSLRAAASHQPSLEEEVSPEPEVPLQHVEIPDWLKNLRGAPTPAPQVIAAPAPQPESSDGLSAPRGQASTTLQPEPSSASGDWMNSLRGPAAAPPQTQAAEPSSQAEIPDWLRAMKAQTGAPEPPLFTETPDWMQPAGSEPPAAAGEVPDWMQPSGVTPAAISAEEPDWLKPGGVTPTAPVGEPTPAIPGEMPDWLKPSGATPAPTPEQPEWMQPGGATPTAPTPELPDWMQPSTTAQATPSAEMPDWLKPSGGTADKEVSAGDEETPEWLASLAPSEPSTLPRMPAIVTEDAFDFLPPAPPEAPTGEAWPTASQLPDWLEAMRPTGVEGAPPSPAPAAQEIEIPIPAAEKIAAPTARPSAPPTREKTVEPAEAADLARAALPAWLEAMRPIAGGKPTSPAIEEYEETAGPLAGMRGVIPAEPVVALPSMKLTAATRPSVSETHAAKVQLLEAILKEETAPQAVGVADRARPIIALIERLTVFVILAVAVIAPFAGTGPTFTPPSTFPAETIAARDLVLSLPPDRPVLIAFEYDPGATGELDRQADALLTHLASRRLRIVTVSTRPLGASLAQNALERNLTGNANYAYRKSFANLGYLPGGALSLPVFAASPREVISADFADGGDLSVPLPRNYDLWQTEAISDVHRISDFSMIAVVANSPEAMRAWIEQVKPYAPQTPVIALVSASAEPLVQPYFIKNDPSTLQDETAAGPLQGIVSGVFGAMSYDQLYRSSAGLPTGLTGAASQRWDAQAFGLLAAAGLVAAGGLIFGLYGIFKYMRARST
ncbi:MAG: hypothetical protein HY260_17655 [Chloroflexi bacterium]|nr:hypothetical protein [Chloroflexota bacterium]